MGDLKLVACQGEVLGMVYQDAQDWMTQSYDILQACIICRTRDPESLSGRKLHTCEELLEHLWNGHRFVPFCLVPFVLALRHFSPPFHFSFSAA
jgi:hypothetical protein